MHGSERSALGGQPQGLGKIVAWKKMPEPSSTTMKPIVLLRDGSAANGEAWAYQYSSQPNTQQAAETANADCETMVAFVGNVTLFLLRMASAADGML